MKSSQLLFLFASMMVSVQAQFFPTAPVSDTVWTKGTTEKIEWRKQLTDAGATNVTTFDIDLGTGSSNKVTILDSVAKNLDYTSTLSYNWNIPNDKYKEDGKVYCLRFNGINARGDVITTSWTTWFTLVNGTTQPTATTTVAPVATKVPVVEVKPTSDAVKLISSLFMMILFAWL